MRRIWKRAAAVVLAVAGILAGASPAKAAFLWSQTDFNSSRTFSLSTGAIANDFTLSSATTLDTFRLWAGQGGNTGYTLPAYSGTMGWAVYAAGSGGGVGTLIAYGQDTATAVTATTNVYGFTRDFQIDGTFAGVAFGSVENLAAGTYWVAFHEGNWGSPSDGSAISMALVGNQIGLDNRIANDPSSPSYVSTNGLDNAFVLTGSDPTSVAPAPPGALLGLVGACCLGGFGWVRRRKLALAAA